MKQNNENGAKTAKNVNESEISQSKANVKNAQQVMNMMVDVLSFIEKNFESCYEAEDRRAHAIIIARQQFEEGMEAISSLIGYETMTIAIDSVKNE